MPLISSADHSGFDVSYWLSHAQKNTAKLAVFGVSVGNPCPFAESAGTSSGDCGLHQSSTTIVRIIVVRIISGLSKRVDRDGDRTNNAAEQLDGNVRRSSRDEFTHR